MRLQGTTGYVLAKISETVQTSGIVCNVVVPRGTIGDETLRTDCSVTRILDWAAPLHKYAGPVTGWNDLDMLEVGNGNMTHDEYGLAALTPGS